MASTWLRVVLVACVSSGSHALQAPLRAIFSDIDGTLVHYARDFEKHGVTLLEADEVACTATVQGPTGEQRRCRLIPSSTMGPACVSERTIELVDALRANGVLFGVVTAARKSTMLQRWPLLPACDFRVCESGSRMWVGDEPDHDFAARFEHICGPIWEGEQEGAHARDGPLWQFFRLLQHDVAGLSLDARSYSGMFRASSRGDAHVDTALRAAIAADLPEGVSWSTNLGKFDFYPTLAGKGHAVAYLQERLAVSSASSACLFDDDNDLPMAEQCASHFLPGLTSASVEAAAASHPSWNVARSCGQGVFAIEEGLEALLRRVRAERYQQVAAAAVAARLRRVLKTRLHHRRSKARLERNRAAEEAAAFDAHAHAALAERVETVLPLEVRREKQA